MFPAPQFAGLFCGVFLSSRLLAVKNRLLPMVKNTLRVWFRFRVVRLLHRDKEECPPSAGMEVTR